MTKNDTQRPQTAAGAPHRNRAMRYAAIAAAVLVVAVSTILLVTRPNDPPPADYHVAVTGNISATWVSDNSDGTLDLTNGGNSEKIRGRLAHTHRPVDPAERRQLHHRRLERQHHRHQGRNTDPRRQRQRRLDHGHLQHHEVLIGNLTLQRTLAKRRSSALHGRFIVHPPVERR